MDTSGRRKTGGSGKETWQQLDHSCYATGFRSNECTVLSKMGRHTESFQWEEGGMDNRRRSKTDGSGKEIWHRRHAQLRTKETFTMVINRALNIIQHKEYQVNSSPEDSKTLSGLSLQRSLSIFFYL
jgi:hypothetical protein